VGGSTVAATLAQAGATRGRGNEAPGSQQKPVQARLDHTLPFSLPLPFRLGLSAWLAAGLPCPALTFRKAAQKLPRFVHMGGALGEGRGLDTQRREGLIRRGMGGLWAYVACLTSGYN
jgi:hypothetical protein